MNFYPFLIVAIFFVLSSAVGAYFYSRIRNSDRASSRQSPQPALRLADQWMADSQRRLEKLIEDSEQPLSAAQNELLELRLSAGRLPQGVKELKLIRQDLGKTGGSTKKSLDEISGALLGSGEWRREDSSLIFLKTPLGEMPVLEWKAEETELSEASMKSLLGKVGGIAHPGVGGFVYLPEDSQYRSFLKNSEWAHGLQAQRWGVMDGGGLRALLLSLRMSKITGRVVEVFGRGVRATLEIQGQSDQMGEALSKLTADAAKIRSLLEGALWVDL